MRTRSPVRAPTNASVGVQDTFFLTGTDEHGQKIATAAAESQQTPLQFCDRYVQEFQQLNHALLIATDRHVRTTAEAHKHTAQGLLQRAIDADAVYLGTYSGWYNVREEAFVSELDASNLYYRDPVTGVPLKRMEEESYFLRTSQYQDRLLRHIRKSPGFICPRPRRNEILRRLEVPLTDISISRTTCQWGIPFPQHPEHVMYVWFDALASYLSGIGFPESDQAHFWPADVHLIGKDIVWFHAVLWPCMLMALDLPLPKAVFAHGFVNDHSGRKMSKTLGNVVDPMDLLEQYPADTVRSALVSRVTLGEDVPFSEEVLLQLHNSHLANTIGNCLSRCVSLCRKYCDGAVPDVDALEVFDLEAVRASTADAYRDYELHTAYNIALECAKDINGFLQMHAPWESDDPEDRNVTVRSALEALYMAAHFLAPFLPSGCAGIFQALNTDPVGLWALSPAGDNLKPGTRIASGKKILYPKIR